jgi:hypothetical protein
MVEISIVCLIYKSKQLAEALYESVLKYTPKLSSGQAEFFFIANDPTEEVMEFLESKNIPYFVNVNEHLSDEELFSMGFGAPEYMRRVYQGYNQGILHAKGQKIVLINSDNFFSEDWLENLLKYSDYKKVVSSTLVEPGQLNFGVFPFAIEKDFGRTLDDFKEEEFQEFVEKNSKTGYTSGGAYMPCLLYKDIAVMAGLYPEGNIAGKSFDDVKFYGDEFFYDRLKSFGVEHITAKDSMVYHLKEGEKSEQPEGSAVVTDKKYRGISSNMEHQAKGVNLMPYIIPEPRHMEMLEGLGAKFTIIIAHFKSSVELNNQIKQIQSLTNKNIEIIVLSDKSNKSFIKSKSKDINYIYSSNASKKYVALFGLLPKIYGEYLLVSDPNSTYKDELFEEIHKKDAIYYAGNKEPEKGKLVDSIGSFIVPKPILISDVGYFAGLFLADDDIELELSRCVLTETKTAAPLEQQKESDARKKIASVFTRTLLYRGARSFYYNGPNGLVRAISHRINRKQ